MTCCGLHNWLLEIDGISGQWEDGVLVSDWEGDLGRMDFEGLRQSIPNAIAQPKPTKLQFIGHGTRS
jgi:hypothetical protein